MASIPLVALNVRTPEQPDIMQKYGQLMQLRNAQQQSQMQQQEAPLRLQALQQQTQVGGLQLQQQQQVLKDQQATSAAMQNWDGKDYNDILPLVLKNGGSAQAVIGLKKSILDQQVQVANAAKATGQAAEAQIAATLKKNDLVNGALSPLVDPTKIPDAQLPQALTSTVQSLVQQGALDNQHAQAASQLLQSGDPTTIRNGIQQFTNTLRAGSQITEEALKKAQTAQQQSTQAKTDAEMEYYKQNGGAPGVSVETQEMNSFLKNNPGKTPQDFAAWKAKQAPLAQLSILNATGQGKPVEDVAKQFGMTPGAFDQTAEKYATTGTLPAIGRSGGGQALNKALMNRAAELHPDGSIAANSAEYKANAESLKKLQGSLDTVSAFENTANKNISMLENIAQQVPDLGVKFANVPVRMLTGNMIGTENMAAFKTALAPVQAESAKILNSANLQGQLSDSSRHELQDIVDGNMPYKSLVASLNVLQQDFKNRHDSTQDQVNDIRKRLGANPTTPSANSTSHPFFSQFGGAMVKP